LSPRHGSQTDCFPYLGSLVGTPFSPPDFTGLQRAPSQCVSLNCCSLASNRFTTSGYCAATSCSSNMSFTTSKSRVCPAMYPESSLSTHGSPVQFASAGGRGSSYLSAGRRGGGVHPKSHSGDDSFAGIGSGKHLSGFLTQFEVPVRSTQDGSGPLNQRVW
jgi:hypothetical protein